MREIAAHEIIEAVARLCREANYFLPADVAGALKSAAAKETSGTGRDIFGQIIENIRIAADREIALCQDTGIADVFIKWGQDACVTGAPLEDAVNKGVALGYTTGYLRKSIVSDPLERKNTGDNTPAQIAIETVSGDRLEITLLPKGGGSENASALKMLTPSAGWEGVKEFVLEAVNAKGGNACPPLVIGVGLGGDFSSVAKLAKKALLREIGSLPRDARYAEREKELLDAVNATGVGPMGLGGKVTALAVHIEAAPCHIASLPVAVSMQCHSCRRKTVVL